ncbi:L-rhamnose-binding lectin CSL3-like [Bradysia coprophila]|uniref:L-rhamnose-binding lectin CSL3-like n=1 Tax=Bradysia coprophila TaxID=38358 RepID=UPI00187D9A47|nr:L-rhamnose-binding lectin CSL3-like [Bradysia coprophila]
MMLKMTPGSCFKFIFNILLLISTYSVLVFAGKPIKKITCEGNTLNISCGAGVIHVIRENYGRLSKNVCTNGIVVNPHLHCMAIETPNIVRSRCSNMHSCSIPATNSVFGDPCDGTSKYLEVEYKCIASPAAAKQTIACEWTTLNIGCPAGYIIDVLRVTYGRMSGTICADSGRVRNQFCQARNGYEIVDLYCSYQQQCSIPALNSVFGDPCPDTSKYLDVQYQCLPMTTPIKHAVACEWTHLYIGCDPGKVISVLRANFGRLSSSVCNYDGKAAIRRDFCSSDRSLTVVNGACSGQQFCSVPATIQTFGDPCGDTNKYLEVDYICS